MTAPDDVSAEPPADVVEIGAQAMAKRRFTTLPDDVYYPHRADMTAALQALQRAGYVVVPREPTLQMLIVAQEEWLCVRAAKDRAAVIWRTMIAAAPQGGRDDGR